MGRRSNNIDILKWLNSKGFNRSIKGKRKRERKIAMPIGSFSMDSNCFSFSFLSCPVFFQAETQSESKSRCWVKILTTLL